jgi:hypothetical protein
MYFKKNYKSASHNNFQAEALNKPKSLPMIIKEIIFEILIAVHIIIRLHPSKQKS